MEAADTLLLGRVTYQGFAAGFAESTGPDAQIMNSYRKYVVSTTLEQADWNNSSLIRGNVVEEVAKWQPLHVDLDACCAAALPATGVEDYKRHVPLAVPMCMCDHMRRRLCHKCAPLGGPHLFHTS